MTCRACAKRWASLATSPISKEVVGESSAVADVNTILGIADQESIGETQAVHRYPERRMLASADQARDEHPPCQIHLPEPITGLGVGAVATGVYDELRFLSRSLGQRCRYMPVPSLMVIPQVVFPVQMGSIGLPRQIELPGGGDASQQI